VSLVITEKGRLRKDDRKRNTYLELSNRKDLFLEGKMLPAPEPAGKAISLNTGGTRSNNVRVTFLISHDKLKGGMI
jgi:hypothetical protein